MTVLRFHASQDARLRGYGDNISMHQMRVHLWCEQICNSLGVDLSPDLHKAALNHDQAERVLGDTPGPAKERFPALAAAYAKAELQVLTEMGLTWNLTRQEADILQLADKADAWLIACRVGAADDPEWVEAFAKLERMADKLGTNWLRDFALAAREGKR
jgi:5'-deoxynucleotidase YfbR-like HD superfamily hydrolase